MEWTWLSYILNVVLGVMGMYVALDGDWAKRHKVLTMLLFFTVTIGSVTTSYFVDKESQKRLDDSHKELVAAIQMGNADLQKVQNKNLELSEKSMDLQAKNAELQKELAEKAELERKRQTKIETEREAALKSRNVNFVTPFNTLKKQARGEIRLMHEAIGPHSTDFFRERAVQWLNAMIAFLKTHCSDQTLWVTFMYPDRTAGVPGPFSNAWDDKIREIYPQIPNPAWLPFAAFYYLRIEDLDKMDLSSCK